MARMIFVNLPVEDVERAKRFYEELGFSTDPRFTSDQGACIVVDDNIFVMLLARDFFRGFVNGEVADATSVTEVLNCLSCDSREQVDATVATAIAAGGKPWKPTMDRDGMYGGSFQDPDGHVWELAYMPAPAS